MRCGPEASGPRDPRLAATASEERVGEEQQPLPAQQLAPFLRLKQEQQQHAHERCQGRSSTRRRQPVGQQRLSELSLVGQRIEVWWPHHGKWYAAQVVDRMDSG